MTKRTLYFGNPAYLKTANEQLVIQLPDSQEANSISIEDIVLLILDNQQITITQALIAKLLENNVALITCDNIHHPTGLMLSLNGHTLQSQKFKYQIEASITLKKQLWQQTVIAKLLNQAALLKIIRANDKYILNLAKSVKSGDSDNCEAKAASYYWKHFIPDFLEFRRDRNGPPPNNLFNYGYAILRAIVARSLVCSGLLPTLGIFHRNQYNAYCLADDIMEPYRPYVDKIIYQIIRSNGKFLDMTPNIKKELLAIVSIDNVIIDGQKNLLMNAVQRTTSSLAKCFEGESRKLLYPQLN